MYTPRTVAGVLVNAFNAAKRILEENGTEGYLEKWQGNFPLDDFKKLEKLRKQALERGVIINDRDGDYVPAVRT